MTARVARHEHLMRIVAHTLGETGHQRRVLVTCAFNGCTRAEIMSPSKRLKIDADYWLRWRHLDHLCCTTTSSLPVVN